MGQRNNQIKKQSYAESLSRAGELTKAIRIIEQDEYAPVLLPEELHAETEVASSDINNIFKDIGIDLSIINGDMSSAAKDFDNLLKTTRIKLDNIKTILKTEKERLEDINILCNKYTDFSDVILVSDKNATTNMTYSNGLFNLNTTNTKSVKYEITDISGNGYEGNDYVYKNDAFAKNTSNTSKRSYIYDNSEITYYEYSRITASSSEKIVFPLVNFDSVTARCSISIKADEPFNTLKLNTETDDIILESFSTSTDGINFTKSDLTNIPLNNKSARYNGDDYIYGCGLLSFDDCNYIKLILKATANTSESIAFTRKNADNKDEVIKLNTAKRSVIKINGIELSIRKYNKKGEITLNNLIDKDTSSIAIFANEYIADNYVLRNSLKYTLTINGIDYEMVPINSHSNGKKIVRTTSKSIPAEHVHYISETIKSANLTISASTANDKITPYISDLKILVGKDK